MSKIKITNPTGAYWVEGGDVISDSAKSIDIQNDIIGLLSTLNGADDDDFDLRLKHVSREVSKLPEPPTYQEFYDIADNFAVYALQPGGVTHSLEAGQVKVTVRGYVDGKPEDLDRRFAFVHKANDVDDITSADVIAACDAADVTDAWPAQLASEIAKSVNSALSQLRQERRQERAAPPLPLPVVRPAPPVRKGPRV